MTGEEVRRVTDALDAVEEIADPEERVRAMGEVMAAYVKRTREWRPQRLGMVRQLRDEGASIRQIAARLGMQPRSVQDALEGYSGSGTARPRKRADPPPEPSAP